VKVSIGEVKVKPLRESESFDLKNKLSRENKCGNENKNAAAVCNRRINCRSKCSGGGYCSSALV
jgi:hypothetical protein